jgi:hypothetical protein
VCGVQRIGCDNGVGGGAGRWVGSLGEAGESRYFEARLSGGGGCKVLVGLVLHGGGWRSDGCCVALTRFRTQVLRASQVSDEGPDCLLTERMLHQPLSCVASERLQLYLARPTRVGVGLPDIVTTQ